MIRRQLALAHLLNIDVVARLLKKTADGLDQVLELNLGVNRFGRDPETDFPVDHPTVSAMHCEIILTAEGVLLRDCNSTNGTFINDEPVKNAVLDRKSTRLNSSHVALS